MQTKDDVQLAHVAALAWPFGTHAAPLLAIVHRLAALSPASHFSFFSTGASNAATFASYSRNGVALPANLVACDVWDGVPEGHVAKGEFLDWEKVDQFVVAARDSFKEATRRAEEESGRRISCLVGDSFFWFGKELAREIGGDGIPWLPLWTSGANTLSAMVYVDHLQETLSIGDAIAGREDELLKQIPGMSKITASDLPEGVVFGRLDSLFSDMLRKMGQNLPLADAVFINSFEELDPEFTKDLKSKLKTYLNIGPLNLVSPPPKAPDAYNCIEWLDSHRAASVTYIGFGSVTVPPPHELAALADALEAKEVPFMWSLKDSARAHLPDGFLERTSSQGVVVPWAPQTGILGHNAVGVFITHGGWNSILESVVGGVPMICRPFFGDQRLNARMVGDVWEIGLRVKGGTLTKDGVMDCLDEILVGENGKKMRVSIKALRSKAIAAVGPQGSSSNNFTTLLDLATGIKKL